MTALTARRSGVALALPTGVPGAGVAAAGVVALAAAQGGFSPPAWRLGAVTFAAAAALLWLWVPPRRRAWREAAPPLLLAAFALWSLASAAWSVDPSASILDAERSLLYVAAAGCFLAAGSGLTEGVLAGATAVAAWALGDRLVAGAPLDPYEGRLLTGPIGYANGLAALLAIGIAVSVALALERRRAYALPLAVLVPGLALTESRGAWAAAAVGVAVAIALVHGRRALAASVLAASTALLALLLLFTPAAAGDRAAYWHAARDIAAAHPFGGTGAGTFFLDYARLPAAHDAHSLYLQSTGELGLVGLGLVLALLLVPLATGLRRRLAAPVAGLATFALHAGVDWDWQLPVVTVAALALAAAAVRDRPR